MKTKIFTFAIPKAHGKYTGYALTEKGERITKIRANGLDSCKRYLSVGDIVAKYDEKFPEGYDVEWVDDIRKRPDVIEAIQNEPILKQKMVDQGWMDIPFPYQKEGFAGYPIRVYK
jgi:hypothetical protein